MASAAFRSSTRRSALGCPNDAGSSSKSGDRRRSRSLSRYSGRVPPPRKDDDEFPTPRRGRFVTTARGSGAEEISLEDLADEFFAALEFEDEAERSRGRGRTGRRLSDASFLMETQSSRRRGRSVSRKPSSESNAGGQRGFEGNPRRRSLSVARYQCSESESESDFSYGSGSLNKMRSSQETNRQSLALHKPSSFKTPTRSGNQQDLKYLRDNHSIHFSSLTDYEPLDSQSNSNRSEKTVGTLSDYKKIGAAAAPPVKLAEHPVEEGENVGFYEVMRKEVRHAVDEIKTELEKVIEKGKPSMQCGNDTHLKSSEVVEAIAEIRRNYSTKLEESERRKQELLAELAAEEQRGQELSKIVKELLPGTKDANPGRPRFRKRSNDKSIISKHLYEEAEKYFEDFLSSVDDTDISSFEGERSDGGSITGGCTKSNAAARSPTVPSPADTDGLVLPWLDWETCNDVTPTSCKVKETSSIHSSVLSASSHGSWSPGNSHESYSAISKSEMAGAKIRSMPSSSFNPDDYAHLDHAEDFLLKVLLQRRRVNSGSLLLCQGTHPSSLFI